MNEQPKTVTVAPDQIIRALSLQIADLNLELTRTRLALDAALTPEPAPSDV